MPPTNAVAGSSSRKRERSGSPASLGRKRARATTVEEESEEEQEVDELQDDDDDVPLQPRGEVQDRTAQEEEVESILLPGAQEDSFDSSLTRPEQSPPKRSSVSSASLAKLLHPENVSIPILVNSPPDFTVAVLALQPPQLIIDSSTEFTVASTSKLQRSLPSPPPSPPLNEPEPLSTYACPICFFPPTNATFTSAVHFGYSYGSYITAGLVSAYPELTQARHPNSIFSGTNSRSLYFCTSGNFPVRLLWNLPGDTTIKTPRAAIIRSHFPDWKYDNETWYLACLLHDIGTADKFLATTKMSFEFKDNVGIRANIIHPKLIETTVAEFPCMGWSEHFARVIEKPEELDLKPWCHSSTFEIPCWTHGILSNMATHVRRNDVMRPFD
ncbi:Cyanamide hydratase [Mycena venus]|uniref:Cyanamide hydratase n=1 Tax=Mycena venus TaxID=2733690 RepID=A0A8H6U083_9AGAR|nr:Cyanamide hydratase [Mycena venus]